MPVFHGAAETIMKAAEKAGASGKLSGAGEVVVGALAGITAFALDPGGAVAGIVKRMAADSPPPKPSEGKG